MDETQPRRANRWGDDHLVDGVAREYLHRQRQEVSAAQTIVILPETVGQTQGTQQPATPTQGVQGTTPVVSPGTGSKL